MSRLFDIAADLDTPVSAYLKLAPFGPRFLLESVEGGERLARYSFLGFGDGLDVRLERESLRVGTETIELTGLRSDLLAGLRGALAHAPVPGADGIDLPFSGGLVGVTAYDFVRRLEHIPRPEAHGAGGVPDAAWFAPGSILVFDHLTRRAALLHDGPETERNALRREVIRALRGPIPKRRTGGKVGAPRASFDESEFCAAVEQVQEHITDGDVFQLVLSVLFSGETDLPPFEVYRALRQLNPSPYMYFFEFDETAVIGSSPEALVRLDGRRASLRPIAGTRPRGRTPEEDAQLEVDLLADPKESAEHVMLVDLARNDLGRVAVPGSIVVDPYRAIERYSHVMHISSTVTGRLRDGFTCWDALRHALPVGTVSGAPKVRAMQIIDELEPTRRGPYAGAVGFADFAGNLDMAIALRTMVVMPDRSDSGTGPLAWVVHLQAGAGIVADSQPDAEHQETVNKAAALAKAVDLAEKAFG